ncbi:putative LRR receptor-like serine/threonine-protein kinase [Abeliophyllum distichum]|uniref:non-specific serine/threonine protein kinase n=1 Tax=Abeliophyllum distichum TaxID=126358 RepID=A0ABD1QZE6_9LAMI
MKPSNFILSFALFFLCHHSRALLGPHRSNVTDRDVLLSFKSYVTDDPTGVLNTWNLKTPLCNWQGVFCNTNKMRVTGLALENCSLTGTITPHIGNLSFLQVLDLKNNVFHGSIPVSMGKLFRLKMLILASNNIQGHIPSSLRDCSSLNVLDLPGNMLEGTIPSELGNLTKLKNLSFAKNNLTGYIPLSFANLSSLKNLILMYNKLEGPIPSELGNLNLLLQINVGRNYFSGKIPSSIFNLSSLRILGVAMNHFYGHLPSNLFTTLPILMELYVGGNFYRGKIPTSLSNASELKVVDFSANQFTGWIPMLWNLENIRILNLEFNQFSNEGENGLDFITSLVNCSQLQVFSVATNRFSGQIPSSIGNLSSQLSLLNLADNQFEGNIPETIGNLASLIQLSLETNLFTGHIPLSIGDLQNLQGLSIHLNLLSGQIPVSLGNLSQLFELRLNGNNLTGRIPTSLSNCRRLQLLDLSLNGLYGSIPAEIFTFPNLGMLLNLSWNSLTGSLSSDIGNLKMVQGLDFSKNRLSGPIPSSLGECQNLLYLDLSGNSLQGFIPSSLANLKGVEFIDLSLNNLAGSIPSLATLQYLKFLNLSNNMLQGEVPKEGIFLNVSGVFLSGNAELCGGIPALGLPKCSAKSEQTNKSRHALIAGLIAGSTIICIFLLLFFYRIFFMKPKKQRGSATTQAISFDGHSRLYSYYDLKSATNNFSCENLIGSGSFGNVYKGVFRDGTLAAIKVFNMDQTRASKSFLAECKAFRNIRHRNLVKILSASSSPTFKALILQFMPNGSLDKWLHSKSEDQRQSLSLNQRLDIAIDIASAMEYLHHDCETPLVHCDLKPSNVLLDEDMTAHVGDFGIARILQKTESRDPKSSTIGLKGSVGYIPPEYGYGGEVSINGDVYSYGILLLEMVTGKRPTEEMFSGELNLQRWVRAALPHRVLDILDNELMEACDSEGVSIDYFDSLFKIGLSCANEAPDGRPEMKDVNAMIKRIRNTRFSVTT